MKVYFDMNGKVWGKGNETILEEHIEVEMAEDVDLWRYSYDTATKTASVCYPGMTSDEALDQLEKDTNALCAAAAAKAKAQITPPIS